MTGYKQPLGANCDSRCPIAAGRRSSEVSFFQQKLASLNEGWLEYQVRPEQLAQGENLLGLRLSGRAPRIRERVLVEKVELRATYHRG